MTKRASPVASSDGHLGDGGLEGRLHLAGELYLHRAGQGLAVVAQQLLPFLGRTEADVSPRKTRDDLARAAVQRQFGVRVQIRLQVGGVQREDVVCPGVEPPAGRTADEVTRLRAVIWVGPPSWACTCADCSVREAIWAEKSRDFTGDDPRACSERGCSSLRPGCLVVGRAVQRIHHIIKPRKPALFFRESSWVAVVF